MLLVEGTKALKKMKNSASESGLYIIESDEDVEKDMQKDENDGNDSDYSNDSNGNLSMRKPSNYSIAWPQSYRSAITDVCVLCFSIWHECLWPSFDFF